MNGRGARAVTRTSDRRPPSRIRSQPLRLAESLDRTTNFRHTIQESILSADTGRSSRPRAAREQHARSPPRVSREARRTFVEPFLTAPFACAALLQRRRGIEHGRLVGHVVWRRRCARREPAAHRHTRVRGESAQAALLKLFASRTFFAPLRRAAPAAPPGSGAASAARVSSEYKKMSKPDLQTEPKPRAGPPGASRGGNSNS